MEVHTHSHTERKKFTHYLWEFLMLFLAVFCGFLAENIREENSNHKKEKEYMKSMLQDLVSDTTTISSNILFASRISKGLDSLSKALYSANGSDSSALKIYRLHVMYSRQILVDLADQTQIQLSNSGGLQLIKKPNVRSAIADYWRGVKRIDGVAQRLSDNAGYEISYSIFNRSYEHINGVDSSTGMSIISIDSVGRLMTNDKNTLINYANRIARSVTIINVFLIPNLKRQKENAKKLIDVLKTEYHLK